MRGIAAQRERVPPVFCILRPVRAGKTDQHSMHDIRGARDDAHQLHLYPEHLLLPVGRLLYRIDRVRSSRLYGAVGCQS